MQNIIEYLLDHWEEKYHAFNCALHPGIPGDRVSGVRIPIIRKAAREMSPEDMQFFLADLPHETVEEDFLHAVLIGREQSFQKALHLTEEFLPYVDSWALCDIINPKAFKKDLEALEEKIYDWLRSDRPYTVRFGTTMLLRHFTKKGFSEEHLKALPLSFDHYYVRMGIAWYLSELLILEVKEVLALFEGDLLPEDIRKQALQKALDSKRTSPSMRKLCRKLRMHD